MASLYVGETARSVSERAGEHWEDAMGGKEESHMLEHMAAAHREETIPEFRFRVVKRCKSALERQVREAVRIEMRGNILNKKGMFNRCKLTRLVVDTEWDNKVWEESWEPRTEPEMDEDSLRESQKAKRGSGEGAAKKRIMRESHGVVWGEEMLPEDGSRNDFLREGLTRPEGTTVQTRVKVYTGVEWMVRELIKECAHIAVEIASLTEGVATWEEWGAEQTETGVAPVRKRSDREEKFLWSMLVCLDKEAAKEQRKADMKKLRKVNQARKRMGAGKHQPSIIEQLKRNESFASMKDSNQHDQEARSEGGQHDQGGRSDEGEHVQVAVCVGEQHGRQINVCEMRPDGGVCESVENPNVDMSVARLSTVCTVVQNGAEQPAFANLLPTPGQTKQSSHSNVEKMSSATPGEASRTDTSASQKVGYKTKFKSLQN